MYAIWRDENGDRIYTGGHDLLDNEQILAGLIESGNGSSSDILVKTHKVPEGIFSMEYKNDTPGIGWSNDQYLDRLTIQGSYEKNRHQHAGIVRTVLDTNPLVTIRIESPSSEEKLALAKCGIAIIEGQLTIDDEVSKKETQRLSKILATRDKKRNAKPVDKNKLGQFVKWLGYEICETLPFSNIQLSHAGKYDDGFLAIAPIATKMIGIGLLNLQIKKENTVARANWTTFTKEWEQTKENTEKTAPTLAKAINDLLAVIDPPAPATTPTVA